MSRLRLNLLFIYPAIALIALSVLLMLSERQLTDKEVSIRAVLTDASPALSHQLESAAWKLVTEADQISQVASSDEDFTNLRESLNEVLTHHRALTDFFISSAKERAEHASGLRLLDAMERQIRDLSPLLDAPVNRSPDALREMDIRSIALYDVAQTLNQDIFDTHQRLINEILAGIAYIEHTRSIIALLLALGAMILTACLLLDVRRYRRLSDSVRSAERFTTMFAAALQSTSAGVMIRDVRREKNPIVFVNDAFVAMTGFSAAEALSKDENFLFGWNTDQSVLERLHKIIAANETATINILTYRSDGSTFWGEWHISPARDKNGDVTHHVMLITDITWQKQTQEALLDAKHQAEKAATVKSGFLSSISHEIRTPINGLMGILDLLSETPLDGEQKRLLSIATNASRSLHAIINDVLDYSKIEAGKMQLAQEAFDVHVLLDELVELMKPLANDKKIELRLEIQGDIPETVTGDPGRIRQGLLNFLTNAIKFTDQGSVTLRLTSLMEQIRMGAPAMLLMFEVIDTGIGISASDHIKLFHEFSQIEQSYTRRHGGTGLGLAITQRLIKMMDGDIGFESSPGKGSRFWFVVPLAIAQTSALAPTPSTAEKVAQAHAAIAHIASATTAVPATYSIPSMAFHDKRIMLVEDNEANRFVAERYLKKAGCTAISAASGEEALALAEKYTFDLILMDVSMPDMDGLEATQRLRARGGWIQDVPIIALTAHASLEDRERCLKAGMSDHLAKPLNYTDLLRALGLWLAPDQSAATNKTSEGQAHSDRPDSIDPTLVDLDPRALATLAEDLGAEAALKIVTLYLDDSERRVAHICAAHPEQGDVGVVQHAAHTLKSSSAHCGLTRFSSLMAAIEAAAQNGDIAAVLSLLPQVEPTYATARAKLVEQTTLYQSKA